MDFDNAESTVPTQEWDLVEDTHGQVAEYSTRYFFPLSLLGVISYDKGHYQLALVLTPITDNWAYFGRNKITINRVAKFASIRSLTLFFSENFGGDTTKISFIGLKGEFSEVSSSYFSISLTGILRRKRNEPIQCFRDSRN